MLGDGIRACLVESELGAGVRADFEIAVSGYAEGRLSALYA